MEDKFVLAIQELSNVSVDIAELDELREKIKDIKEDMIAYKAVCCDKTPVTGGVSKYEERLCKLICLKSKLETKERDILEHIQKVSSTLLKMDIQSMKLLGAYYIRKDKITRLAKKYGVCEKTIRRRIENALFKYVSLRDWSDKQ